MFCFMLLATAACGILYREWPSLILLIHKSSLTTDIEIILITETIIEIKVQLELKLKLFHN